MTAPHILGDGVPRTMAGTEIEPLIAAANPYLDWPAVPGVAGGGGWFGRGHLTPDASQWAAFAAREFDPPGTFRWLVFADTVEQAEDELRRLVDPNDFTPLNKTAPDGCSRPRP